MDDDRLAEIFFFSVKRKVEDKLNPAHCTLDQTFSSPLPHPTATSAHPRPGPVQTDLPSQEGRIKCTTLGARRFHKTILPKEIWR